MMGPVIHAAWLLVLLVFLATARLTRLVNEDAILDGPRAWIQRRAGDTLTYFVSCPWCVSIWASAAVAGATYAWHDYWEVQVALLALSASMVTGVLAQIVVNLEAAP